MYIEQSKYNEILKIMPITCVDVCIVKDNKIFLAKRNNEPCKGQFYIPGGRVIKNEELKDTAHRKALEETGLDCYILKMINVETTIYTTGINQIPTHNINICFKATIKTGNIVLNSENSEYIWVTKEESKKYDLHPYVRHSIENINT